jgi:apolipoprotein N-acyltransferase
MTWTESLVLLFVVPTSALVFRQVWMEWQHARRARVRAQRLENLKRAAATDYRERHRSIK